MMKMKSGCGVLPRGLTAVVPAVVLAGLAAISGCSGKSEEPPQDHVFKGYENALEKAKQVAPQLEDAEEQRRKQLEEVSR